MARYRTVGISQKLLDPVKIALGALSYSWISTGEFARDEAGLLAVAVIGLLFGLLTPPNPVEPVIE